MKIASILIALALLLLCAAPASADWKVSRATEIANAVWDAPCGGNVTVKLEVTSLMSEAGYNGQAAFGECPGVVYIDPARLRYWRSFCSEVIHEFGHVAGWRSPTGDYHSVNPLSIMYEIADWDVSEDGVRVTSITEGGRVFHARKYGGGDPRCRNRGRTYLSAR